MLDSFLLGMIFFVFFLAGLVKGVIGMGLPAIALGLLTASLELTTAIALTIIPAFITNIWQGWLGPHRREVFLRIWPYLLIASTTVWIGSMALTSIDLDWLSALLGVMLIGYAFDLPPENRTI